MQESQPKDPQEDRETEGKRLELGAVVFSNDPRGLTFGFHADLLNSARPGKGGHEQQINSRRPAHKKRDWTPRRLFDRPDHTRCRTTSQSGRVASL